MPMEESYWEQMKSPIADMKNTGGRMGGAITAALFLKEYVDTDKASAPVLICCREFLANAISSDLQKGDSQPHHRHEPNQRPYQACHHCNTIAAKLL